MSSITSFQGDSQYEIISKAEKQHSSFLFVYMYRFFMIVFHDNGNHNEEFMEWNPASISECWHYEFEDGVTGSTSLPADLPGNDSTRLTITNTLPELRNYDSLFFRARHVLLRVFVDGQLRV